MFPTEMQQNPFNGPDAHLREKRSNGFYAWARDLFSHRSHSQNVSFGENGRSVSSSTMLHGGFVPVSLAALGNHVQCIFFLCSKENMVRIHARSVIAVMKRVLSLWNFVSRKDNGESVRRIYATIKPEVSMSVCSLAAKPRPALANIAINWMDARWPVFINFIEKQFPLGFVVGHKQKTPAESKVKVRRQERQWTRRALNLSYLSFPALSDAAPA